METSEGKWDSGIILLITKVCRFKMAGGEKNF